MRGRWVTRYSEPGGIPFWVWERSMPRISDQFTECAVYLYASVQDAKDGARQGGSGFLVGVPSQRFPDLSFVYAVTNWHVARKAKSPVIRMNRKDGGTECFATELGQWKQHPDGDDVACFHISPDVERMKFISIRASMFVTQDLISREDIGIGDDVFMIGRFINHDGKQRNSPAVRFGNVAMMATERIETEYGVQQESLLVEVRSLPGYSGSAVFLFSSTPMNDMSQTRFGTPMNAPNPPFSAALADAAFKQMSPKGPYLLGIDFCHLNNQIRVRDKQGEELEEGWIVKENTGMAGVIPAWKIHELLFCDELSEQRRLGDQRLADAGSRASFDDSL
jgi:hypothetical protein